MSKAGIIVIGCLLTAIGFAVVGHCIQLKLGSEALNAWGAYITGSATFILAGAGIAAGLVGLSDYQKKAVAEKAKWLLQLYEKLFEIGDYKEVRRKIDYGDLDEIKALIQAESQGIAFTDAQKVKFDQFTDYLNFFELIAHLREIGQLTEEDIKATFDYYLKLLTKEKNPEIHQYLEKTGFENLDRLLKGYEEKK